MPIPTPISVHDQPLAAPDLLTTIQFNFEWRRLIVELLWEIQNEDFWSGSQADIEDAVDKASAMIEDIYTEDPLLRIAARLKHVDPFVTIPAMTNFVVEFEDPALVSESYDYGGFWDVGDPDVLTIPANRGGIYLFSVNVQYLISPPDVLRKITILINGSDNVAVGEDRITGKLGVHIAGDAEVSPGDTIILNLWSAVADFAIINFSLHRVFN